MKKMEGNKNYEMSYYSDGASKIYDAKGQLLATVYYDDFYHSYKFIPNYSRYDYYEGKWDDELE
jgi:hypothetical protein